jgi:hypothetical protein
LVSGTHLGAATNFSFLSLILFRQLWVCWCGAPSLMRSRICSFQFLPGIASAAFLISESHGSHEHILLSLFFRLPQPGGPRPLYLFLPETWWPSYTAGHWVRWCTVTCITHQSRSRSSYVTTHGQSASSSWSRAPFEADDQILHFFDWQLLFSSSCGAPYLTRGRQSQSHITTYSQPNRPVRLGVRRPSGTRDQFFFLLLVCHFLAPSLTKGRVCNLLYDCFWALPEQSFLGRSPAELNG